MEKIEEKLASANISIVRSSSRAPPPPNITRFFELDVEMEHQDPVVASINTMLQTQPFSSSQFTIYKVPKSLRSINLEAYTPQVISIGPFHYGESDMIVMEEHKLRYLQSFFRRTSMDSELVVRKVRSWEERARNCYAEPIKMSSDEFVKLILVDGCFIVEFMMRFCIPELRDPVDRLFDGTLRIDLICDLIKLENQIPFFVLESLFKFYPSNNHIAKISFTELSYNVFAKSYRNEGAFYVSGRIVDHFVHLLWQDFIPPPSFEQTENSVIFIGNSKLLQPPTATELNEAGVVIKRAKNKSIGNVISGITFRNGVLEIPNIDIYDYFETYIRNLIAFEQCHKVDYYVTHFAIFMDDLINTEKDVSFLIERGIISNHLGSNEDVCKLFNNLGKQISIGDNFYFNNVSRKIHEYCGTRRHRWMASLRRDYFNTPWASISFAAAAFLLILTLIQTIFSGLSIK